MIIPYFSLIIILLIALENHQAAFYVALFSSALSTIVLLSLLNEGILQRAAKAIKPTSEFSLFVRMASCVIASIFLAYSGMIYSAIFYIAASSALIAASMEVGRAIRSGEL